MKKKKKVAIADLERILNEKGNRSIILLPNGEISTVAGEQDSFDWMKKWLDAYDESHAIKVSKAIMDWVLKHPMGC